MSLFLWPSMGIYLQGIEDNKAQRTTKLTHTTRTARYDIAADVWEDIPGFDLSVDSDDEDNNNTQGAENDNNAQGERRLSFKPFVWRGDIYCCDGQLHRYDPENDSWKHLATIDAPKMWAVCHPIPVLH
mgnify:FL=1